MRIHRAHDEAGWKVTLADTREKFQGGARLKKSFFVICRILSLVACLLMG